MYLPRQSWEMTASIFASKSNAGTLAFACVALGLRVELRTRTHTHVRRTLEQKSVRIIGTFDLCALGFSFGQTESSPATFAVSAVKVSFPRFDSLQPGTRLPTCLRQKWEFSLVRVS